mmetsp:Transcript_92609/g.233415  ORF Transcript_92609/g.233415 Transcript_92609/m.233415 type:complete len:302 (+) Transcript_92609:224-1129(+)
MEGITPSHHPWRDRPCIDGRVPTGSIAVEVMSCPQRRRSRLAQSARAARRNARRAPDLRRGSRRCSRNQGLINMHRSRQVGGHARAQGADDGVEIPVILQTARSQCCCIRQCRRRSRILLRGHGGELRGHCVGCIGLFAGHKGGSRCRDCRVCAAVEARQRWHVCCKLHPTVARHGELNLHGLWESFRARMQVLAQTNLVQRSHRYRNGRRCGTAPNCFLASGRPPRATTVARAAPWGPCKSDGGAVRPARRWCPLQRRSRPQLACRVHATRQARSNCQRLVLPRYGAHERRVQTTPSFPR